MTDGKKNFLGLNIVSKFIVFIGISLLVVISAWAYFIIRYQNEKLMAHIITDTDRLTETIRLGTHYAMTLNSRDDINQIIRNIGQQEGIERIHIYNKEGEIKYSNLKDHVNTRTNIRDEACIICHRTDPALERLDLAQRTRIIQSPQGYRLLGIITPIFNEPGCSTDACHFHPKDKKILGALDLMVSLEERDREILGAKKAIIGLAGTAFIVLSYIIFIFVHRFINAPIQKLIEGTSRIADGDYENKVDIRQEDEMGLLAQAINQMGDQIQIQRAELNAQRDEYRTLFDYAPCMISVQDRDYRLLRCNRQFIQNFDPKPGSFCYQAYKGLDHRCDHCPMEKTFEDGQSHYGEGSGMGRDGTVHHWIFIASPLKNARGEVVSAIEMSIDITARKQLERKLEASEKKYQSIFNAIPNPVFILDQESLDLVDCNPSAESVYGFSKTEILKKSFRDFFIPEEQDKMAARIKTCPVINRVRQIKEGNRTMHADIWVSPLEYDHQSVWLVITSDITQRLETERELIQAGKMATLGEMSTGIAHELNQPLSVIKTASDFILKKLNQSAPIEASILHTLLTKINGNVDRASKIIDHMRHFARKSDINFENVQVNDILKRAYDIFSQQLKVRGIEVVWCLTEDLPMITADPSRIEQVFINLLVNARDAIEEKSRQTGSRIDGEKIFIETQAANRQVIVKLRDTGIGVPEEIREKIFEPFFTTKDVGKGTGLGLSISYGIVKECKGHIQMVSDRNGTTFILRFPFAKEPGHSSS